MTHHSITINKFPCPPSVNRLYTYYGSRVQKSKEYRDYESNVALWRTSNQVQVKALAEFSKGLGEFVIHIDALFHMSRKSILCKNGKPKKNDTSNRLKALHDVICASIIEIDDSYFWSGSFSKIAIEDNEAEYVDVVLRLRSINE